MISVIVPVYNVEKYLNECVESLISQTCCDIEIILVDDGSRDSSGKLCDEWAAEHDNITVIHKQNGGLSSARNAGLDAAKGEYISFIDSDDIVDHDMMARMKDALDEHPDVSFAACYLETFIEGTNMKNFHLPIDSEGRTAAVTYLREILRHKADNAVCSKMFRASAIGELRFVLGRINEDILFMTSFLERNWEDVYVIPEGLYKYRIRPGSITQQINPRLYDFIENAFTIKEHICRSYGDEFESETNGYIYHEMVNFISTIQKYKAKEQFREKMSYCLNYLSTHRKDFISNRNCSIMKKLKLALVLISPGLYRFMLKYK